jgi:hypothetical protein
MSAYTLQSVGSDDEEKHCSTTCYTSEYNHVFKVAAKAMTTVGKPASGATAHNSICHTTPCLNPGAMESAHSAPMDASPPFVLNYD